MKKILMVMLLTLMPAFSYARNYDYASMLPISVTVNQVTAYGEASRLSASCVQDREEPYRYRLTFNKPVKAFSYYTYYAEILFDTERDVAVCIHITYDTTSYKQLFHIIKSMADEIWQTTEDGQLVVSCMFSNCVIYFYDRSPVVGCVLSDVQIAINNLRATGTKVR